MVHPLGAVLASRIAGTDPLSTCVATPSSLPIVGCRRHWSARPNMGNRHLAGAPGPEARTSVTLFGQQTSKEAISRNQMEEELNEPYSPPFEGGVAARSRKCCEATLAERRRGGCSQ